MGTFIFKTSALLVADFATITSNAVINKYLEILLYEGVLIIVVEFILIISIHFLVADKNLFNFSSTFSLLGVIK